MNIVYFDLTKTLSVSEFVPVLTLTD